MPNRPRYEGMWESLRQQTSSDDQSGSSSNTDEDTPIDTLLPIDTLSTGVTNSSEWNKVGKTENIPLNVIVLGKMKTRLYNKICAGEGPNIFYSSMMSHDERYIKSLTSEIEEYIDLLSQTMNVVDNTWDQSHMGRQGSCAKYIDHCFSDKLCRKIPGFRTDENKRGFIPQMYHILQDYGFFAGYIGIDNISTKLPIVELEDWYVEFGIEIGINYKEYGKRPVIVFMDMMMLRMRRVQFMRSFETHCCLGLENADNNHIPMDEALERIYQTILRVKNRFETRH